MAVLKIAHYTKPVHVKETLQEMTENIEDTYAKNQLLVPATVSVKITNFEGNERNIRCEDMTYLFNINHIISVN